MKKWIILALSVLLLLSGCVREQPEPTTLPTTEPQPSATQPTTVPTEPPAEPGSYVPDSPFEQESGGALRCFDPESLLREEYPNYCVAEYLLLPDGVFLAGSGFNEETGKTSYVLTILAGEDLHRTASREIITDSYLCRWMVSGDGTRFAYYDEDAASFVMLDGDLQEAERAVLPADAADSSTLLSPDFGTIYYTTGSSIREYDIAQGNSVLLREGKEESTFLESVMFDGACLLCGRFEDGVYTSEIVDADSGELLFRSEEQFGLWVTGGDSYFVSRYNHVAEFLFGQVDGETHQLGLGSDRLFRCASLEQGVAVMSIWDENDRMTLEAYDLETGRKTGSVTLPGFYEDLLQISRDGKYVWMYSYVDSVILCWEIGRSPTEDETNYITPHYTLDNPDLEGLAACEARAKELGKALGVKILVWSGIDDLENDWYTFQKDYHPLALQQAMDQLERAQAQLPEGFLAKLATWGTNRTLTIALVDRIVTASEFGVPDAAGLQYWDSDSAYIVLELDDNLSWTFFHELFHVIDTAVMSRKNTYDDWANLNPEGADYFYSYTETGEDSDSLWTTGDDPAFLDLYSMSYPNEDRARIFEYAMMPYNSFETPILQNKLAVLCEGIRKAFRMEGDLPWEQYLVK